MCKLNINVCRKVQLAITRKYKKVILTKYLGVTHKYGTMVQVTFGIGIWPDDKYTITHYFLNLLKHAIFSVGIYCTDDLFTI